AAICAVRACGVAAPVWQLLAPGADLVDILHDRDDHDLAADARAAAGEDRGHHLVAAVCLAAEKTSGDLRRLERLPHLVAALRGGGAFDLRILPVVPFSAP